MILSVGVDIVDISRISKSLKRFGRPFMDRILLSEEIAYCLSQKDPAPFVAARIAAKEAIAKAFGTGIGVHLGWKSIEIGREENGQPFVILHEKGKKLLRKRRARSLHISLSHTKGHAVGMAVLEA